MARCAYCNASILFGGSRDGDLRFCNDKCHESAVLFAVAEQVPDDVLQQHLWNTYQGPCPTCKGSGPVDVHTSYRIWSAFLVTSWCSRPHISCKSCGWKSQLGDAVFSFFLGWWGFPWGLMMTPVQVYRNFAAMFHRYETPEPSPELAKHIRLNLAAHALSQETATDDA